jgi:membrane protease YdiL (CAAX protease family)
MDSELRPDVVQGAGAGARHRHRARRLASARPVVERRSSGSLWPGVRPLLLWLAIWAVWVAAGEWAIATFGLEQATPWKHHAALVLVLRILAIGCVGPISEELVMRGIVFAQLRRTALRTVGAIVVCAAGWAVMHVQYGWSTWVLIFLDGLILGAARAHSRSLVPPILMHMAGNLFSIYQSLHR